MSFQGFGVEPSIGNGILLEGSLTDFLMMENGTDYLLQEAIMVSTGILLENSVSDFLMLENGTEYLLQEA